MNAPRRILTLLTLVLILILSFASPAAAQFGDNEAEVVSYGDFNNFVIYSALVWDAGSEDMALIGAAVLSPELIEENYGDMNLRITYTDIWDQEELDDADMASAVFYEVVADDIGPGIVSVTSRDDFTYMFVGIGYLLDAEAFGEWCADIMLAEELPDRAPPGFEEIPA